MSVELFAKFDALVCSTTMKSYAVFNRLALVVVVLTIAIVLTAASGPLVASTPNNDKLANIPKPEYRSRRERLLDQIKDGVIVLAGAREEDFGEVGRFRQLNDF